MASINYFFENSEPKSTTLEDQLEWDKNLQRHLETQFIVLKLIDGPFLENHPELKEKLWVCRQLMGDKNLVRIESIDMKGDNIYANVFPSELVIFYRKD